MYKKLFCSTSVILASVFCNAQPYCWLWHKNAGSSSDVGGNSIALYANSVYNSGMFTASSITIDDSVFYNRGLRDIYLVKRDAKGNMLWAKTLAGTMNESVAKIDVDNEGAVYIGGTFSGTMQSEGAISSSGGTDIFIAKYNASGAQQWIKAIGSSGNDSLMTLVVDAGGRLRIVGSFSGTLTLGPYTLNAASGAAFTASFESQAGTVQSARNYAVPSSIQYIKTDKAGNIYYAGTAYATLTFGSFNLTPGCQPLFSSPSVFWAAKLDTAANVLWLKDLAPCNDLTGLGYYRNYLDFFVDSDGLVYFALIEGRWPAFIGPSPGDPYLSLVAVFSTDGVLIERGGLSFNGFLGSNSIIRYILDASNRKVLLRNVTFGQLEYVTNIITQSSINDALAYVPAQNYTSGAIDSATGTFYFTGKSFLNKLGRGFEVNAGADKFFCGIPSGVITLGGSPAAACGTPPYVYAWSPATGLSSATVANPTVDLPAIPDSITYILTVTDALSTVKRDTMKIIIRTAPLKPLITAANNILFTDAPVNGTLQWLLDGAAIPGANSNSFAFTQDGKYRVQLSDGNQCSSVSDTFYAYRITVNAGNDTAICSGKNIRLGGNPTAITAAGSLTYEWSPANNLDNSTVANPVATPPANVMYRVLVKNSYGNHMADSLFVSINPSPSPVITQSGNVLHSGYATGNQWFLNGQPIPNATGESFTITQPGQYAVQVTNSYGCSAMSNVIDAQLTEMNLVVFSSGTDIRIKYNLPLPASTSIELINIGSGIRKILQQKLLQDAGTHTFIISNGRFSKGAYVVRVITEQSIVSSKLIIR